MISKRCGTVFYSVAFQRRMNELNIISAVTCSEQTTQTIEKKLIVKDNTVDNLASRDNYTWSSLIA